MGFGNKKLKNNGIIFRDVVAQAPTKTRRIKSFDGYFSSRSMLMLW